MLQHMARREGQDDFLSDFPWIGGTPGPRATLFTAIWITAIVILALSILVSFVLMEFVLALVLIVLVAIVGSLPMLFLIGSRI